MGVSYQQLRAVCQEPVAATNDVAGLLFGDRASLPLTKLFVDLGISPAVATVGMLVCGLIGSGLQLVGETAAVVGALLMVLYYLLDCVDGEVARWRRIEHARWGYYESIFHFVVKPVAFGSIGFAAWRDTGSSWVLVCGFSAAVSCLWLKMFLGLPAQVFVGTVLKGGASGKRPWSEYAARVLAAPAGVALEEDEVFRLRFDRVTLRCLLTNFDVGMLLLVLAAGVDLLVDPVASGPLAGFTARAVWMLWYGCVLPLDFLDYVATYVRSGHFDKTMVRLLGRAHGFTIAEAGEPPSDPPERA